MTFTEVPTFDTFIVFECLSRASVFIIYLPRVIEGYNTPFLDCAVNNIGNIQILG